ncbi:MAG: hypothetical protein HYS13_17210 [Planctomycetia bacterium]|nr:hypothetical protein [Planctomycetia bacterium]
MPLERERFVPPANQENGWIEVASVAKTLKPVEKLGGKVVVPAMKVPGVGELACCADPDGLVFAVVRCETSEK